MLHQRIAEARVRKNLTQQQVAQSLGIARSTYANYERGKRNPDSKMLARISELLNVSLDHLILGDKPIASGQLGLFNFFEQTDAQSISHVPVYTSLYMDSDMNLRGEAWTDILISSKLFPFDPRGLVWLCVKEGIIKSHAITRDSFVLIELRKNSEAQGDIVAVCIGDHPARISRAFYTGALQFTEVDDTLSNFGSRVIQQYEGEHVILTSDDPASPVQLVNRNEIQIIGKVIMVVSKVARAIDES